MGKDYYAILGVPKNASADDVKKAFRRLAHEHHPDKGGDAQKFKDLNEAYQILSDPQKRAAFDQYGSAAFEQGGAPGGGPGGFNFGGFDFSQGGFQQGDFGDLGDILGEMFGFGGVGGGRGSRSARGKDIEVDAELTLHEAAFGLQKTIRLYKHTACSHCQGKGAEPGATFSDCATCHGTGQVKQVQRSLFGTIQTAVTCSDCHGQGKKPSKTCSTCQGVGIERREQTLQVGIPAGIDDGEALKISQEGEAAPHGGTAGDLYVRVHVKADPRFERDGTTIRSELLLPLSMFVLGGSVEVPTLDGMERVTVPAGTPAKTILTLRGKGIPSMRSHGRGNHLLTLIPDVPHKLSREQKALWEQLQKEGL